MIARFRSSGFTLIELLIVIAIIGILSSLLMSNYIGAQQRGRDAQRKSDLKQLQIALEQYKADNGHYPCTDTTADTAGGWQISGTTTPWIVDHYHAGTPCGVNGADMAFSPSYMTKMPKDPLNSSSTAGPWAGSTNYAYFDYDVGPFGTCAVGSYYLLVAQLENKNDKDRLSANDYTYCGTDLITNVFTASYPIVVYTAP